MRSMSTCSRLKRIATMMLAAMTKPPKSPCHREMVVVVVVAGGAVDCATDTVVAGREVWERSCGAAAVIAVCAGVGEEGLTWGCAWQGAGRGRGQGMREGWVQSRHCSVMWRRGPDLVPVGDRYRGTPLPPPNWCAQTFTSTHCTQGAQHGLLYCM